MVAESGPATARKSYSIVAPYSSALIMVGDQDEVAAVNLRTIER